MVVWTEEMKAKAAATRAANKAKKEARRAKRLAAGRHNGGSDTESNVAIEGENSLDNSERVVQHAGSTSFGTRTKEEDVQGVDWEAIPLAEAITLAADMKREYERIAQIIVRRQNPPKAMWTCWSQENKELVPRSVLMQCLKRGEDGRWKFRDDGRFVVENGVRRLKPAFCCNFLCYQVYQKYRVTPPAREAQVQRGDVRT